MSQTSQPLPTAIQQYLDAQTLASLTAHADAPGQSFSQAASSSDAVAPSEAVPDASQSEATSASGPAVSPFELRDLQTTGGAPESATLDMVRDVELDLKIELGRTQMYLEDVLKLRKGSVVPLDRLAGDPVDIRVNGRLVARGEILVLNDNFCVRVLELVRGGR